jgi:hypothetical protein
MILAGKNQPNTPMMRISMTTPWGQCAAEGDSVEAVAGGAGQFDHKEEYRNAITSLVRRLITVSVRPR